MRVVQALHWLRDLLVREGESDQVKRKLAKLFEDPAAAQGRSRRGMTALPTWMLVFLKPLIETDRNDRRQRADDDDHAVAEHDRDRHRRAGDDDQRKTNGMRPKPKPLSTQKKRPAKRGTTRAAKA